MRLRSTLVLMLALSACGGEDTPPIDARPPVQVDPNFTSIQQMIFTPRCATTACHGPSMPASSMSLVAGSAYSEIVGVLPITSSARTAGKKLVDPGNPNNSFLIDKLEGNLGAGDGNLMPQNGSRLYPVEIAPIRQWIMDGALQN